MSERPIREPIRREPTAWPRLIPARLEPGLPDGERAVLAAFAEQFPAAWTLFHHLAYSKPRGDGNPARPPREAELDLLLLAPQRGCLAIEIKSGASGHRTDCNGNA